MAKFIQIKKAAGVPLSIGGALACNRACNRMEQRAKTQPAFAVERASKFIATERFQYMCGIGALIHSDDDEPPDTLYMHAPTHMSPVSSHEHMLLICSSSDPETPLLLCGTECAFHSLTG